MDFKKYNKLVMVIMVFIFTVTLGAVVYNIANGNSDKIKVNLYFIDNSSLTLKAEERVIPIVSTENTEIVSQVLNQLQVGPKSQSLKKSIPDSLKILGAIIEGETVTVNLSSEFNDLKAGDAVFCKTALICTLTDLDFVKDVKLKINGEDLRNPNGEIVGPESMEDIVIDSTVAPEKVEKETVKLYFANKDFSDLEVEEREIEFNPFNPDQKPKYIVEQLIIGPKASNSVSTIPSETKIRDVKLIEGTCFLDLSKDFIDKYTGGSTTEWITIESIVNSLTEIPEIKKVQFLIEGEKQQEFMGHLDFSKPFERTIEDITQNTDE